MISNKNVDIKFSYTVHFWNNEVLQSKQFLITSMTKKDYLTIKITIPLFVPRNFFIGLLKA
jgi:hypothetical protein